MNTNGKQIKKVLCTGCSGQDGSYMVDYLLENTDHEIYGMVRRAAKPDYSNIKEALKNDRFKLVVGDLSDSQSIDKVVSKVKPNYFINFGAQSFVASSWELPEMTMDVNSSGVVRCLESIIKYVPNCRFYNAGSSEEFGKVEYSPQDENHPYRPQSPYGASKVSARQVVRTYRESFNLYAIQGILFNHESPRRGEEFVTRKITKGIARIKYAIDNNIPFQPIELGNLEARRDWSHAKDFVVGIWAMLNQPTWETGTNGIRGLLLQPKEYILSSDETHSIREFIELAFKEANINGEWLKEPIINNNLEYKIDSYCLFPNFTKRLVIINPKFYRPADVELLLGDSTKARTELGWKPKYNFQQLVAEMVSEDIKNYKE